MSAGPGCLWRLWEDLCASSSSGSPMLPLTCGSITLISASIFIWPSSLSLSAYKFSLSYKGHSHIGVGPTLLQYNLIFIWLHLQRAYFQIRLQSYVPVVMTSTKFFFSAYILEWHNSTHNTKLIYFLPLLELTLPRISGGLTVTS